ncbi:hypothetical protein BPOR_0106g00120 [Botrytis porri]|uniref:Uncharacterized protein n=1 Tax=Botrytis porri TaxID=87229 RepID=A0A4Z1KYC5_9HELO|nr:hypothetical protein BPOR_0106g00120 [Botrytis porri]
MEGRVSMDIQQASLEQDTSRCKNEMISGPTERVEQRIQSNARYMKREDQPYITAGTAEVTRPSLNSTRSTATSNGEEWRGKRDNPVSAEQSFKRLQSHENRMQDTPSIAERDESARWREQCTKLQEDKRKIERSFNRYVNDMDRHLDNMDEDTRRLQAKIEQLESDKLAIEEKHNAFIQKQQEVTFSQMTTSHWRPAEDRKVMGDFDRLKRDMRSWAKKAGILNDMASVLSPLDDSASAALRGTLERVVQFRDDNTLPNGLVRSKKKPGLLLNALLSHGIYTTLFRSPFFFAERNIEGQSSRLDCRDGLEEVYDYGILSNEENAHLWRSQTLRLLFPPIETDISNGEVALHEITKEAIAEVANQQASKFLAGPARYLIANEAREKIYTIHREAATMSYNLWTRRTRMKCYTLQSLNRPTFDPDDKHLLSHSSVDYESHEDRLIGKPIDVIVHPLVMVYGTDDGENYQQGRVWAPAEVWLDSKSPSA